MPDCPYGSSYEPVASPPAASVSGPVPVTPLDEPRERSARVKLTAGAPAGCAMSVGVGAGVLASAVGMDKVARSRRFDRCDFRCDVLLRTIKFIAGTGRSPERRAQRQAAKKPGRFLPESLFLALVLCQGELSSRGVNL